jgi:hypothetical protein
MDRLDSNAPGLYTFIILLITMVGLLVVGSLIFGIWKILEYERRRRLRTRFDSEEQEMEAPIVAV